MQSPEIRKVFHLTQYHYEQPAECSHQVCILKPQEGAKMEVGVLRKGQRLLQHTLHIHPPPSTLQTSTDSFGNVVHHFEMNSPHDQLTVNSELQVETYPALHTGSLSEIQTPAWDQLHEELRYHAGQHITNDHLFRFESKHVMVLEQLRDYGSLDFWPNRSVVDAGFALMQRIHREFTYKSGSTTIDTTVKEVMEKREGVCQDFAHVMLGILRSLGLSAHYVSGYMLTQPAPGQTKLLGADASHAWVSLWCGNTIGWVDFDPTNNQLPDTRYVTLAVGRDYADVPPVRGVVHGGGEHNLSVEVTVF
jgi:transglutaminase-like putative cysteine protease